MTPTVAAYIRKTLASRLAEIEAEAVQLRAALAELDGGDADAESLLVRIRGEAPNGQNGARPAARKPEPNAVSPSSARLDALQEAHGPVFRVRKGPPVQIGQKFDLDGKHLEILEADNLPGDKGEVVPNNWFAKQVEG